MKKKNSNPVGALKRTGAYMKSSLDVIALALVLAALSAVMTIIGPDKIGKMATIMSDGLFTGIDLAAIAKIGVFLAIIYCLSALFGFIQHYIMAVVTLKMSYRMRGELSEKINRVPQKYFNTTSQGDILSRITNDVSTLQQGLTNSLPTIISAATQFVGCLIMMFVTEWRMALVALCITLLGMVLIVAIMSKSQRYFTARQKSLGELNGYVEEMYSGHEVVRISRAVDKVLDHFDGLNAAVYDANWLRCDAAAHERDRQPRVCCRVRVRLGAGHQWHDRIRRHRLVHPVCAPLHHASDADRTGHDEFADGLRLRASYFRLPRK